MGSGDDTLRLSTTERVQAMVTAKKSAQALTAEGKSAAERGSQIPVPLEQAKAALQGWPEAPQKTGRVLLEHYGVPHEMTDTKFFWYRTGPWAKMELTADEVVHNFATPHTDFLAENMAAYAMGRDAPYAERLQFTPATGTADPDEGIIGQAVLDQLVEKVKDTVGQGDTPHA